MKQVIVFLLIMLSLSSKSLAQKDTVNVEGFKATGLYGTLNDAIDTAIFNGTINNTVFKLAPYEKYVLNRSIYLDPGLTLEIVAPKPGTTQATAPPQIVWTEEQINKQYVIQSYGDIIMKNVWVRYADVLGYRSVCSIVFENQDEANDPESGYFEGCIFDYAGIGAEDGGAITVKADHFTGEFRNCYWRNNSDDHYRYYGRAVSFPYASTGWHYDFLLFENCSFTNISRIVMMEGNEYGSNIHLNHCTILNSVEWIIQSGWIENLSITNSIFVNPRFIGYRAVDVCSGSQNYDDFLNGECEPPGGALFSVEPVDSFDFDVNFTDYDRKIFVGNNDYIYQNWLFEFYTECSWCKDRILHNYGKEIYNPFPCIGERTLAFINSTDQSGNKIFTTMNVDTSTLYFVDPEFIKEATNDDTLQLFLEARWFSSADFDWSYKPAAGLNHIWPLPENLAHSNIELLTAAMNGFPLGDLNWFPELLDEWKMQEEEEWENINSWLNYGSSSTNIDDDIILIPTEYSLYQNYPNPFNPVTTISYSLPEQTHVSIKVFDVLGREVTELVNEIKQPGNYKVIFDGSALSSGVYFYSIETENFTDIKKLILLK